MNRANALFTAALLVSQLLVGCATGAPVVPQVSEPPVSYQPLASEYALILKTNNTFEFVGQADTTIDQKSGGGMMYPSGHPAVFLASIFTHAAVQNGVTRRREAAAIEQSNLVLGPFSEQLRRVDPSRILPDLHTGLSFATADQAKPDTRWQLTINPIFVMSRTQDAIGVAAQITLSERLHTGAAFRVDRTAKIFVQSERVDSPGEWRDIDGERIASTVTQLLRRAAETAVREFSGDLIAADASQTIRYLDNNTKLVERGRIIETTATQITFRSLRDEIKVMPTFTP